MQINLITERYALNADVLEVVLSLIDDEMFTKEECAAELINILKKYDLMDRSLEIDEIPKNRIKQHI